MAFNWIKFPWTNLHDLNLDWIIQTVKTLEDNLADAVGKFTEIANSIITPEREERISGDAKLQSAIDTEHTERLAGDAAIQAAIEHEIKPSIKKAMDGYVLIVNSNSTSSDTTVTLTSQQVAALQNAAQNNYPITLILKDGDYYTAYYPIVIEITSMLFGKVCNFNSLSGGADVNQALGRMVVARVNIQDDAGILDFIEFPSGLTPFLPLSLSITWTAEANSYTLTDKEYAILRQSLLDKRAIMVVRNTADVGGEQTIYSLQTCKTPSILNVDSMTLVLQGPSNSIKVQMASKTIVPLIE